MMEFSLNLLSSAYVHFMGFLFTCSPFILFLGIIIAFNIFIVRYLTKKERLTLEEPQNKDFWVKSKKAALGFEIATIIFLSIPLLLLLPYIPSINETEDDGFGNAVFAILLLTSIAVFLSSFSTIYCYNFLFYVANNRTATIILFIPLSPLILCCLAFFPILFPCAIFMVIAGLILQSKRKRFFKTIEASVFLDKPAN